MSLLVNGFEDEVQRIKHLLVNYHQYRNPVISDTIVSQDGILKLSTKYYTLDISIRESYFEGVRDESLALHDNQCFIVILPSNMERISTKENFLGNELGDIFPNATKIAVTLMNRSNSEAAASEVSYENHIGWSLDHGFEFIDIDESNLTQGWDIREKESLPRLIEALESTMWPKSTSEAPTSSNGLTTNESAQNIEENEAEDRQSADEDEDFDDASLLNEISSIFEEVRRIRENATSNSLSDDERRERAAAMALKLSEMLSLNGFDDEDV